MTPRLIQKAVTIREVCFLDGFWYFLAQEEGETPRPTAVGWVWSRMQAMTATSTHSEFEAQE